MVGGELEPEEKEELAEKIGKLLQRDRMGVRMFFFSRSKQIWPLVIPCTINIDKWTMGSQFISHVISGHNQFLNVQDAAIDFSMVE